MSYYNLQYYNVCVVSLAREHDKNPDFDTPCSSNLIDKNVDSPDSVDYWACSNHDNQTILFTYQNQNYLLPIDKIACSLAKIKGNYDKNIHVLKTDQDD